MIYRKDGKVVDRALRSEYLGDLKELGQAYELESRMAGWPQSMATSSG